MRTVLLNCALPAGRVTSAIRRIDPMALVICGGDVRDATVERLEHAVRLADCRAPLYEVGEPDPPGDERLLPSLGPGALEAELRGAPGGAPAALERPAPAGRVTHRGDGPGAPIWGGDLTGLVSIFGPGPLRL
jgi:hypothetical protein